jgi:hypothetical protein
VRDAESINRPLRVEDVGEDEFRRLTAEVPPPDDEEPTG